MEKLISGVLDDPRSQNQKNKDYQDIELITSPAPVKWQEWSLIHNQLEIELNNFPVFNQDGSSSCVAHAFALSMGIDNWLEEGKFIRLAPADIYDRRQNNSAGMYFQNAADIAYNHGATLYDFLPSDGLNEQQISGLLANYKPSYGEIAKIYKTGNYFWIQEATTNIDRINYWTNIEKRPIVLGVRFGDGEWNRTEPQIKGNKTPYGHGISIPPNGAFLYKGKKTVLIQDNWSANSGWGGRRFVSEDWWKAGRIIGAISWKKLIDTWRDTEEKQKPHYKFEHNLKYGTRNNDIIALQDILKYEELFANNIMSTGYYGNITAKAVLKFQLKYKVDKEETLRQLEGRIVGPKTREILNKIY